MPPKKTTILKEWDTYALAEGTGSVDSLWASSSVVSVIYREKPSKSRRYAGLVGHFSSPETPVFSQYLERARSEFGDAVRILIRGGSFLTMTSDPKEAKAELLRIQRAERSRFLKILKQKGYSRELMDIVWAKDNKGTKIIYHAKTGIAEVLTQVLDPETVDLAPLPDVFGEDAL